MDKNRRAALRAAIGCALIYSATSGVTINCRGIFYASMAESLQISLSVLTTYVMVGGIVGAFFLPALSRLFRKYPVKRVLTLYSAVLVLSTVGMSLSGNVIVFYAFAIVQCTVNGFLLFYPIPYIVGNFYPDKKGTVLGFVLMSSGIVGVVLNPPLERLIQVAGWRNAFLVTALLMAVLQLPAELFLVHRAPEYAGCEPVRETVSTSGSGRSAEPVPFCSRPLQVLPLTIVFAIVNLYILLPQQLPSVAASHGFSTSFGALLVSSGMAGNMVGKLIYGRMNDRIGIWQTAVSFLGITLIGFVLIAIGNQTCLLVGSFLFAALLAVQMVSSPLLFRAYARPELYDRVYPVVCSVTMVLCSVSQFFYSLCFEQSGSYGGVLFSGSAACLVCILIVLGYEYAAKKSARSSQ